MKALIFPGQGSQVPGMGAAFFEDSSLEAEVAALDEAIGASVKDLCLNLDADTLRQTQNAQVALFSCSVLAWKALIDRGIRPDFAAGHSVGEYAALVAGGVLSASDGARLVRKRGELMAKAGQLRSGGMLAPLGLTIEQLEPLCEQASEPDSVVVIANDNCPGQIILSGDLSALERITPLLSEAGARKVMALPVSGAFHSPLMQPLSEEFYAFLKEFEFAAPKVPVVANVTAQPEVAGWPELLRDQLVGRVRWTETVGTLRQLGTTHFVECGVGEVLSGLAKRIFPESQRHAVTNLEQADALAGGL